MVLTLKLILGLLHYTPPGRFHSFNGRTGQANGFSSDPIGYRALLMGTSRNGHIRRLSVAGSTLGFQSNQWFHTGVELPRCDWSSARIRAYKWRYIQDLNW